MSDLIQDVVRLEEQLAEAEQKRDDIANTEPLNQWAYEEAISACNLISNRLSEKRYELEQQQSKVQREIKTAEAIDSYVDTVAQIWDALFPAAIFEGILGINEYAEKRQDFYKLNHTYFAEKVEKLNADHEEEIAAKDEKIRTLNLQGLETENQLAEANRRIEQLQNELHQAKFDREVAVEENEKISSRLEQMNEEVEKGKAAIVENCELRQTILRLEEKIAASQQPKTAEKPSENLQSMLEQVKSKSVTYQAAINKADAALVRLGLVEPEPPEVEPVGEASFPHESGANSETNASDHGIHPAEAAQVADTFPETAEQRMDGSADAGLAAVTRQEFEALRADVEILKRRTGMVA